MHYHAAAQLVVETLTEWWKDNALRLAAALAFYVTFSLAPMTLLVLAASTLLVEKSAAQAEVVAWMRTLVGDDGVNVVLTISEAAGEDFSFGGIAAVATGAMVLGATAVFAELQDALNTIFKVKCRADGAVRAIMYQRLVSFFIVLGIAFLIFVSVAASAVLSAASAIVGPSAALPASILQIVNIFISLALLTVLFALLYKLLPNTTIAWPDALVGAFVTSLMFTAGKSLIGFYLGSTSLRSLYGAAGSFVVVLLWVYYSALIFFFGAEFTRVYGSSRSRETYEHPVLQNEEGNL